MFSIYVLIDPRFPELYWYCGKTEYPLRVRLQAHLRDTKKNNHKNNWIKKRLSEGVRPQIKLIFEFDKELFDWKEVEKFYISKFRCQGHPLTNTQDGGEGWSKGVYKPSVETRQKISKYAKDMWPKTKERLFSPEVRAKAILNSKTPEAIAKKTSKLRGQKRSPEIRKKLKQIFNRKKQLITGIHSPKSRKKTQLKNLGKKRSQEIREKLKYIFNNRPLEIKQRLINQLHSPESLKKHSISMQKRNKGYSFNKGRNKWMVDLWVNGSRIYGGMFYNEADAIAKVKELRSLQSQD